MRSGKAWCRTSVCFWGTRADLVSLLTQFVYSKYTAKNDQIVPQIYFDKFSTMIKCMYGMS